MTTLTAAAPHNTASARPGRLLRIARLHLANPSVFLGIPWLIVGMAWLISVIITMLLTASGVEANGQRYSWAVVSPQWYLVIVGIQAVTYTFPFSLGFGATRRDFWLGTSLLFGALSLVNGFAYAILIQLEKATDGWFVGTHMFDALWYGIEGFWFDVFSTFSLQLFVFFVGAAVATIYMRWRSRGMLVWGVSLAVLILAGFGTITLTDSWLAVSDFFTAIGLVGVFALLLIPTVFSAVLGYLVIRRATPR